MTRPEARQLRAQLQVRQDSWLSWTSKARWRAATPQPPIVTCCRPHLIAAALAHPILACSAVAQSLDDHDDTVLLLISPPPRAETEKAAKVPSCAMHKLTRVPRKSAVVCLQAKPVTASRSRSDARAGPCQSRKLRLASLAAGASHFVPHSDAHRRGIQLMPSRLLWGRCSWWTCLSVRSSLKCLSVVKHTWQTR